MRPVTLFICLILSSLLHAAEPLPVTQVFNLSAKKHDPNTISLNWTIAPDHYLYKKRLKINANEANVGNIFYPPTSTFTDSTGKSYDVYAKGLQLALPLLYDKPGKKSLQIGYQGCAQDGFCYPPQIQHFVIEVDKNKEIVSVIPAEPPAKLQSTNAIIQPEQHWYDVDRLLVKSSLLVTLVGFYILGLLLSFTPCVLPMIPILSSIIVGQQQPASVKRSLLLSLSYVLGMAVTYALIGLAIALLGQNLQLAFQSPYIITCFSLLFFVLALSMFGVYDLKLPDTWHNKLSQASNNRHGKGYLSTFIMGILATLILSPCVSAPLVGVLGFIAKTGDVVLGASSLFLMAIGMGTPLLIIGLGAGTLLPKAGHWMNDVKHLFGVVLVVMAVYTLSKILSPYCSLYLYGIVLLLYGCSLRPFSEQKTKHPILRGMGALLTLYGCLLIIGGAQGNESIFKPLEGTHKTTNAAYNQYYASVQTVKTLSELQRRIQSSHKPVLVDFYASWCSSCKIMEANIFNASDAKSFLAPFELIKVDVTANSANTKSIMEHYGVIAPPTFLFFDKNQELRSFRIVGEKSKEDFLTYLKKVESTIN